MSVYTDNYHEAIDKKMGATVKGNEMITEIDVQRESLSDFMTEVAKKFQEEKTNVIYGTVRLIEKDEECFLTWAKDSYACVIFNLHVDQNVEGLEKAKRNFRFLIDMAIKYKGSYFLTYHRFATREQVLACYPQFPEFLKLKKKYDPEERFQSEWYRHYKKMFAN
jgi:FAD/FMN-containing dehydrogenase